MWQGLSTELQKLFGLIQKAQARLHGKRGEKIHVEEMPDLRKCTWGNVMEEVQSTANRWKNRPDKEGNVMKFIKSIEQNSASLQNWLGLLPTGDYGSR